MIKQIRLISVLLVLSRVGVFCSPALWEEALKNMETIKMEHYAYTITSMAKGHKTVQLYEPLLEDEIKWQLIMKEDKLPTAKEQTEYKEKKQKELKNQNQPTQHKQGKNRQMSFSLTTKELIDPASLQVIAETDANITYSFKLPAKMMQKMDCLMQINKTGKYIEFILIKSPAPFSPAFGVEIKNFKMEMTFAPEAAGKAALIRESRFIFQGSAYLIAQFDEDSVTTYSNYQYRGVKKG